jgi:uncharacterized protein YjiS (DUF1127 family)
MIDVHLMEIKMTALSALFTSFRRGRIRRSAVHTLRGLSAEQLADLGIACDGIEEVVDALITRQTASAAPRRAGSRASAIGGLHGLGAAH